MPVHDWSRVPAGTYHDFHTRWISHLTESLNAGLLPEGLYAQAEQSVRAMRPDVIALSTEARSRHGDESGVATMTPPSARITRKADPNAVYRQARRSIAIRHVSGHQLIALIEVTSPPNKDRLTSVQEFVRKLSEFVASGVHVLLADLFAPGKFDPHGLHGEFWQRFDAQIDDWTTDSPVCLASYEAVELPEAWIEPLNFGDPLPDMPLFYDRGYYVNVPLEATSAQAWRGVPQFWKDVVEGRTMSPGSL